MHLSLRKVLSNHPNLYKRKCTYLDGFDDSLPMNLAMMLSTNRMLGSWKTVPLPPLAKAPLAPRSCRGQPRWKRQQKYSYPNAAFIKESAAKKA